MNLTWKDLCRQANAAGFGDDEYCSLATVIKTTGFDPNIPVWDDHCNRVACYAVRGGSEGWYVHVERQVGSDRLLIILAKFWCLNRALEFVTWATRKVYEECY